MFSTPFYADTCSSRMQKQAAATPQPNVSAAAATITERQMKARDLFERLGLSRNCSSEDVQKAYRRMALYYHPDKNVTNAEASEIFILIGEARDVLSEDTSRAEYIRLLRQKNNPFASKNGMSASDEALQRAYAANGSHIYNTAHISKKAKRDKPREQRYIVRVSLEQMDRGCKIHYEYKQVFERFNGSTVRNLTAVVDVPMGAMDGERIVHVGAGNWYRGYDAADVVFILEQAKHSIFTRRIGADLYLEQKINPLELITGFDLEFPTVYKEIVKVTFKGPLKDGQLMPPIIGKGMRKHSLATGDADDERGNVIVRIRVDPDAAMPTKEQIAKLQSIVEN